MGFLILEDIFLIGIILLEKYETWACIFLDFYGIKRDIV
jgi:hypothetical protein